MFWLEEVWSKLVLWSLYCQKSRHYPCTLNLTYSWELYFLNSQAFLQLFTFGLLPNVLDLELDDLLVIP